MQADRDARRDAAILARHKTDLLKAREHSGRWSTRIRNCEPVGAVWLKNKLLKVVRGH